MVEFVLRGYSSSSRDPPLPPPSHETKQYDGYMAAVPSKHDLASFVRSIHAELALAVPPGSITTAGGGGRLQGGDAEAGSEGAEAAEADLSLAPLLLKGVSCAVKLLCAKVERMHSVEEVCDRCGIEFPYCCNHSEEGLGAWALRALWVIGR